MGVSFAKSVKFGAVRFNFSGSGIGMSVGIPGLRIGTGPRGAYIAGGMAGFRYRKSLGAGVKPAENLGQPARMPSQHLEATPQPNIIATVMHEEKSVLELTDSSGDALIQSMNEQRQKTVLWPFAAGALAFSLILLKNVSNAWPGFVMPGLVILSIAFVIWLHWRDKMRKLTVLFFEPDSATTAHFEAITAGTQSAASSRKLQAVAATSAYADTKYSAGASSGLKLTNASCVLGQAPGVIANVVVPILQATKITLAFYPDRILAFQGKTVGAIDYADLEVKNSPVTFVESESVPSDATITGKTWQYVNKKGCPDRRFKNNREMPLCRYNELRLTTGRGLDIYLMCSRDGGFDELARVLRERKVSAHE
ncbi:MULTISPECIES: DUF4236 domain-containing protein [unclassified Polaromonas]|uniref:DUF4236 domain-containing protein n=1 Tax=unclassified Polaromonas TaxID=2638319 RepID=UPI000BC5B720|nr:MULTISPECIES: DUF4236 domain-containing protein [unclassified Polaromonas]OYY32176.1 MAG: hypothetical protein B7Y60_23260 [Polaromonas sp. 35-63-35]OYZ15039.1 MAG: hypothetical protein B7Y28_22750 [Polaromonas sp. 16-63-31]OYZ75457.1 MAG: hypothetical protein B7Y09_24160 [Polaromonas sp. 24-63-21]OZA45844.1 MAG: hypothetical protein B7X88_24040 [Polaromonas sp. 17-63-33]OZA85124.1 MAG: hypothetical protein B7X65_22820 [Polaromonas sp. 39-63-25]